MINKFIQKAIVTILIFTIPLNARVYTENLKQLDNSYSKDQSMGDGWVTHRYKFYASSSGTYTVSVQADRKYIRMKAGKTDAWKQEFFRDARGDKDTRKQSFKVEANQWVYLSVWKDDHSSASEHSLSYNISINFNSDSDDGLSSDIKDTKDNVLSSYLPKPFECESVGTIISYVTSGSAESGDSNFKLINLSDGTTKSDAVLNGEIEGVNSIGYNIQDDFVWGYNIPNRKIVRIDANRNIKYYEMDNTPNIYGSYYNAADVDKNGVLYLKSDYTARRLDRVELDGNKNKLHVLESIDLNETMYSADFAFNPIDGNIYYVDSKDGYLKKIQIEGSRGFVTSVGFLNKVYTIIAAFDKDGNFYYNNGEKINKVTFKDGKIDIVIKDFSKVEGITQGDGARCPNASIGDSSDKKAVKDYGDALDDGTQYNKSKYAYKYEEGDPRQKVSERVTDDVYLGSLVDAESVGNFDNSASGDDNSGKDDEDSISSDMLSVDKSKESYIISVHYKNKGNGIYEVNGNSQALAHRRYISAWIDWDNDGTFDNDELIDEHYKAVEDQSEGDVKLKWSIPHELISAGDKRVMRLRLTECAYGSDLEGEVISFKDCSNAENGYASFGEIEDYIVSIVDTNKADAVCYATTDDSTKLFIYNNLSDSSTLAYPKTINLTRGVFGEGGAYRAVDGYIYQFNDDGDTLEDHEEDSGPSSLYKINIQTGEVSLVKEKLLSNHVDAAEFYYDKESKKDIFYVIERDERKLYAYNPDDWSLLSGYPKTIKDKDGNHVFIGGLAIDPYSGKAYGVRDYGASSEEDDNPQLYELNLQTAVAKSLFMLPSIDAEGLAFADDGNLYVETEDRDNNGDEHKIFKINLIDHSLTKVSHSGTESGGDIETLSCNAGESQTEAILSIDQSEIIIPEGDINTADGTNGKNINITITSNKALKNDVEIVISQKNGTAILGEDFKIFSQNKIIMKKGTKSITFSQPSVIADNKVEKDEYFICEFSSTTAKFEKDKDKLSVKIIDNDYTLFDAFDTDESISMPYIKTKVVGETFTLKLAKVLNGNYSTALDDNISDLKAIIVPKQECVSDISQLDISKFNDSAVLDIETSIEQDFTVDKVIKVAKVQFLWKNRYGLQTSCSSDSFSVRPSSYKLDFVPNTSIKAGDKFDIVIKALKADGVTIATNYNESQNAYEIKYDEMDKSGTCQKGTLNYTKVNFINGVATLQDVIYNEIGKIKLTVSEVDGSEFAVIDKYDGSASSRFISKDSFVSSKFLVANVSLIWNFSDKTVGSHTFYDNHPLVMGADLSTTIIAQDTNHNPLKNFTKDCSYAENVFVEFDFNKNGDTTLGNPIVEYDSDKIGSDAVHPAKASYYVYAKSFNAGVSNADFYINFARQRNVPLEPTAFTINKIKASMSSSSMSVTDATSKKVTFVYGRAHIADIVGNKIIDVPVDYEVYCKNCLRANFNIINGRPESRDSIYWYIIPSDIHTDFSNVKLVYGGATASKISRDRIRVTASSVPHKNIITYVPEDYLLFDRYNPVINRHKGKISHLSNRTSWAGKGKTGFVVDENISTVNESGSIDW